MATLIHADGTGREVTPKNARAGFTLRELYALLDCSTVEVVALADGRTMVLDEDGKYREPRRPVNERATRLLHLAGGMPTDFVTGDVLIVLRGELK